MWDTGFVEEMGAGEGDYEDCREVGDLGSLSACRPWRGSLAEAYQFA